MDWFAKLATPNGHLIFAAALMGISAFALTRTKHMDVNFTATLGHPITLGVAAGVCFFVSEYHRSLSFLFLVMLVIKAVDALINPLLIGNWALFYPVYSVLDALMILGILYRDKLMTALPLPVAAYIKPGRFVRLWPEYLIVAIYGLSIAYNLLVFVETWLRTSPDVLAMLGWEKSKFFFNHYVLFKAKLNIAEFAVMATMATQALLLVYFARRQAQ